MISITIPGWDGVHPALVHFPIALLFAAPLLLLVSLFARTAWRSWAIASLVLMVAGTVAAWLAASSGHAAAQLVDKTPDLERAIGRHESLAVTARDLFTLVTVAFASWMALQAALRKPLPTALRTTVHALFLVVSVACAIQLVGAADRGGRLVHEAGIKAMVSPPVAAADQAEP
jgi:uncharacterized membrane protein